MKIIKLFCIVFLLSLTAFSQVTTITSTTDTVLKEGAITFSYPIITVTNTITTTITSGADTVYLPSDTVYLPGEIVYLPSDTVYLPSPCDSVTPPNQEPYTVNSMYAILDDWIGDPDYYLTWAKREGVNELNLYARAYLTSSSKHSTLAAFVKKAKEQYGMKKVNIDYRLTSELPSWQAYHNKYKGTTSALDGMITEREPYVTGDWTGFWPFLRDGSKLAKQLGIEFNVYMGHPSQQGWDSIVYYADKVFLSLYIPMSAWNNSSNGYNYVTGRWGYIANAAEKAGKTDFLVVYIISLERKVWGAYYDFMGEWFINNPFFGETWKTVKSQYETNSTTKVKTNTELIGTCIFYGKYAKLARP